MNGLGNPIGNTIANTIGNAIANTIGNAIGNSIGNNKMGFLKCKISGYFFYGVRGPLGSLLEPPRHFLDHFGNFQNVRKAAPKDLF